MPTAPHTIHPAVLRIVRGAGMSRDVIMITVGILLLDETPRSISLFGAHGIASALWALMLLVGGAVSLIGVLLRTPTVECAGCFTVGGGFAIWTVAAVTQPDADITSWAVGLVFAAGTVGQLWRGLTVASGVLLIDRRE